MHTTHSFFSLPMRVFFLAIFCLLLAVFFLEFHVVRQTVYGDGRYYFAFTRAIYFQHNIDISSEMAHAYDPIDNNLPASFAHIPAFAGKTKEITHGFSLGISLIWLPFYAIADGTVVLCRYLGLHITRNGYSDMYQIIVGIGNILFVIAGLWMSARVLSRWYSRKTVVAAIILMLFATNLFYYSSIDVVNSHPASFFFSSVLLWIFFRYKETRMTRYLLLQGCLVGIMGTVRTEDLLFLVLPLVATVVFYDTKQKQRIRNIFLHKMRLWGLLLISVCIGYLPQVLLLYFGQGHFVLFPHTDQKFTLFPMHLSQIIFSQKLGIFFYMPIVFFALAGLLLLKRKMPVVWWLFLVLFFLHLLLISSWAGWDQASYSMRYFISTYPCLAFGLAEVVTILQKRYAMTFISLCICLFVLHEVAMMVGFKLFLQDTTMVGSSMSQSGELKLHIIHQLQHMLHR